ncbi:MAG: GGDEF domain-containing protein [Anaerolineales bacterium]
MEETLDRELLRAFRNHLPLGIIMLDVDDFKRFNDTCGHAAGDAILRELGSLVLKHVRGEDIPSRYGGDELIIVLPDSSREVALARAELLREQAQAFRVQCDGRIFPQVTISLGVAVYPENGSSRADILKAADDALYRAKHQGRSRVVMAA